MIKNRAFLITLLCLVISLPGCANNNSYKLAFSCLGTTAEINVPVRNVSLSDVKKACAASKAKIAWIDRTLSIFDRRSPVSAINNNSAKKGYRLNPELYLLIRRCEEYFVLTQGAFDITVEPIVNAWGFGPDKKKTPDDKAIREMLHYVGMDKMELRDVDKTVYFKDPRVKMDFGGVADGYAVDETIKILKRSGIRSAIVNVGGELYCLGDNYAKKYWSIGIRNPDNKDELIATLNVRDKAVATSGDYENFNISGGERYAHIVDPRTGRTVKNNLRSVTVLADDCTTADALATAIFVMGEKRGIDLINKLTDIDCFLVVKDGTNLKIRMSNGMKKYLAQKCEIKKE
ncbi:MAG: FAD:protein FMN transferase [Candidatus Omnitrophica bacterium]|nr:FAD:protein FMN transferase [Candidatus Omnitrophota bacterium]